MSEYKFLIVEAGVRYYEDAEINGVPDENGTLTPFVQGEIWKPVLDIEQGAIVGWPKGTTADIHFKVCDAGEYWLSRDGVSKDVKYGSYYVPDKYLCHGDTGYGDYIIMKVDADGVIEKYKRPVVDAYVFAGDDSK